MEYKIAGVVVLYYPDVDCIQNIYSYLNQIDYLFAIDNSEIQNSELINKLIQNSKVKYIFNKENLGIAAAMNQASSLAIKNNFDFLLTMDQDTSVDSKLIENYRKFLSNDFTDIGILAPVPTYYSEHNEEKLSRNKEKDFVITSGCLLNLRIFEKVGLFKEDLFIDYVDFEYCLRLRKKKYRIIQLNSAKIFHQLGYLERRKIIFWKFFITNHSPLRYYYRTRNRLYVDSKYLMVYPSFVIKDIFIFFNELIKVIFYEKNGITKIRMILLGLKDFIKKRYGKFENIYR
jgi:rhamnosyltransferase